MYNGVGLQTARGSGTNGYVQRNFALVRHARQPHSGGRGGRGGGFGGTDTAIPTALTKAPDQGILEHYKRREVELKCAELEDELTEQGVPDDEVEAKVDAFRAQLLARQQADYAVGIKHSKHMGTHEEAAANQKKDERARNAFGIVGDYRHGEAFNETAVKERREQQRAERRAVCVVCGCVFTRTCVGLCFVWVGAHTCACVHVCDVVCQPEPHKRKRTLYTHVRAHE